MTAAPTPTTATELTDPRWQDEQLHLGVSWYPEMWPEAEWPKDAARLKEAGFTLVRVFEFAWKMMEPSEGVYDFAWARKILDLLHEQGIQAMLGTPTAAPPAWLTTAYPEVLGTKADGKQQKHGKRKHYNQHSAKYREFSTRIVQKMVEELGDHPAVHSWQIDNEMGGYDYGEETTRHFHAWLERKFGTVEHMNETWGLNFWSQAYDTFEQVPLCTAAVGSIAVPERNHPSLIMAIAQFQNEAWTRFIAEQCDVIRAGCAHPITTNMTGAVGGMDWFRHFRVLDRSGASMYADMNYYYLNYVRFDRLRGDKPTSYWLLETAPNWSGGGPIWNIHHDERGIQAFSWLSILAGGSMVLYWQFRSHWAGQEMQHGTCVSQTGKWMPGLKAWQTLSTHFANHGQWLIDHPHARGPIGIMASSESAWVFSIDPIHPDNKYLTRLIEDYQMPLVRSHLARDVIHPDADLSPYKLLILPHLPILPEAAKANLKQWVADGGVLLLGPLSGTRTEEMTTWTEQEFGGLEELMGAESALRFSPHWVEDTINVTMADDGQSSHPRIWCEAVHPAEGTDVLASYQGGYGDGLPAITEHAYGKGRVIYLGCPVDEAIYLRLVNRLAAVVGISPLATGGEDVVVCPRVNADGSVAGLGLINGKKEARSITLPQAGTDLLTGERLSGEISLAPLQVRIVAY